MFQPKRVTMIVLDMEHVKMGSVCAFLATHTSIVHFVLAQRTALEMVCVSMVHAVVLLLGLAKTAVRKLVPMTATTTVSVKMAYVSAKLDTLESNVKLVFAPMTALEMECAQPT